MKSKVKQVELTQQEWQDALRIPTPHKNKKKYSRKGKNKRNWISEDQFVYLGVIKNKGYDNRTY